MYCDDSRKQFGKLLILLLNFVLFIIASMRQRAKKVMSDIPGLLDFAIRLVIFVLNLPVEQVPFFGKIQIS